MHAVRGQQGKLVDEHVTDGETGPTQDGSRGGAVREGAPQPKPIVDVKEPPPVHSGHVGYRHKLRQ
jgi:hypothetical protein